ncbi:MULTISPECIES: glycoside hydrolase family 3 C-terminal domain-containing protein [Streptomyces]|uniref:Glycoside hydrolase family 3 C-terminal domain-containing protein n=1 Tax=Streptomyces flaveolus TaxID=67297 RepID=A0ABV3ADL7_9ACTN|nr:MULTISPECIES: glycoside hydrolase family 3 C-terminal domain-containing protein [Streptomyces]
MNQPAVAQPKVSLAQSSPTVGTFRERDGALEWSGRQETVRIEPWGPDAVRVRARLGGPVLEGLPGALLDAPAAQDETVGISAGEARLTVGALTVEVTAEGMIRLLRTDDRTELLAEERAHFWWPGPRLYTAVGNGHHRLEQRFAAYDGEKLYGLGQHQHGRLDQKGLVLDLVQRNAEVSVPVLVSSRGYTLFPHTATAAFDTPAHRELAREAAEQAIVLLKNDDDLLPLAPDTRIAVVGLLADECKLDWYSGSLIHRSTPLEGLYERFGAERVEFAEGVDRVRLRTTAGAFLSVPPAEAPDRARGAEGALDPALLAGRTDLPPLTTEATGSEFALADWGGGVLTLRAPDGRYLSVAEDGYLRASADQPGGWVVQETFRLEPHRGGHLLEHLGTGRHVRVAADGVKVADTGDVFEVVTVERGEEAVARVAGGADVVVVVAGNDPHINGRETEDRTTLQLPEHQLRLLRAARAANPRTVLALVSAYPYAVDTARLPAALWTAHGGQAAGTAVARVLAGDVSPAGRLPQTWYASDADLPDLLDYDVIGSRQTYLYFEGTPLFPFGHGLSYASFAYAGLTAGVGAGSVRVGCTVTHTGDRTADEVVQLYGRAVDPSVPRPRRELLAHRRITLSPDETAAVSFEVPLSALEFWDVAEGGWRLEEGPYELLLGASSEDVRLRTTVHVDGRPPAPRPVLERGLAGADFDEQSGVAIVDRTKTAGDAVTPAHGGSAELVHRSCDFGAGVREVTARVAGEGTVELSLDGGPVLATLTLDTPTDGPYAYTDLTARLVADGVHDVRLRLRGPLRLAHVGFSG